MTLYAFSTARTVVSWATGEFLSEGGGHISEGFPFSAYTLVLDTRSTYVDRTVGLKVGSLSISHFFFRCIMQR